MPNITIPYDFKPRDYQLDFLRAMDSGKKRALLVWHRQAGKDMTCFCYMAKAAMAKPGNYFYLFPTKEMARRAVWEKIEEKSGRKLLQQIHQSLVKRLSNQEMMIELVNGSTIRFVGLDTNIDAIRGVSAAGAVLSEFAFSDPEAFKALMPSIRVNNGWVIINSTPNGRNHFYNQYMNVKNSNDWFVSHIQTLWPKRENYTGLVSQLEIDLVKTDEGYTDDDIEREYGCSFSSGLKGSYYTDQIERAYKENRILNLQYNELYPVDTFWDLGVDDDTAVWFRQSIGNKIVFIDYYEGSNEDIKHYIEVLGSKKYKYRTHYLPHDAGHRRHTGKGYVETISDIFSQLCLAEGISDDVVVVQKTNSKQNSIYKVRARFPRMYFDIERCQDGLKKLELYHRKYDRHKQVFLQTPVHDSNSHAADAIQTEADADDLENDYFYKLNRNNLKVNSDYDLFD